MDRLDFSGCANEGFFATIGGQVSLWSLVVLIVICKPLWSFKFSSNHAIAGIIFTPFMTCSCSVPPFLGWSSQLSSTSISSHGSIFSPCLGTFYFKEDLT
ncbi:green-sensitive opsin-1-like isoform X2 [Onychostoma macrolepis]|uniref:green-sensitive opsin-1-like isoform X2 n=1 Tax=Onychostoma macrolepis TaxID=369639 RepID=UPI00272B8B0D|nr:green-sensitive opsin-1-like isoform X2 [Onychostoma macrolepis]